MHHKRSPWSKGSGFQVAWRSQHWEVACLWVNRPRGLWLKEEAGGHLGLRFFCEPHCPLQSFSKGEQCTALEREKQGVHKSRVLSILQREHVFVIWQHFPPSCWKIRNTWIVESEPTQSFWTTTTRESFQTLHMYVCGKVYITVLQLVVLHISPQLSGRFSERADPRASGSAILPDMPLEPIHT